MIGRVIQNYRVEELLGEGGMGTVYRAEDTLLQRPVALKMLHPHLLRDTTFFERFRNEAILSARLNHPNVATLYNFLKDQDDSFMVMELVDGATLEQLLRKQGPFSVENAVRVITQALDGLSHAHRKGILHRDIKPANLMLTKEGGVKLMDFGIARLVGSERLTRVNRVMGTLEYLAPELLDGGDPSEQSDLYAVGVLLYELLSGKMPFNASTDSTLISQILHHKPIPIREHLSTIPKALEDILEKLLQKKPEKRYSSAQELRQALTAIAAPGLLDWNQFQAASRVAPPTRQLTHTADKPRPEPTRLAGASDGFDLKARWQSLKENALSQEGLILLGAILLALTIVVAGFLIADTPASQDLTEHEQSDSLQQASLTPLLDEDTLATSRSTPAGRTTLAYETRANYPVTTPIERESPPADKEQPPRKQKPAEPRERTKTPPPTENETLVPKESSPREEESKTNEVKEEDKPVETKPAPRTVAVELRNESFPIVFTETITSDQVSRNGSTFWLRTGAPVVVNGNTIIESGARVRGRITEVRASSESQRAYLAVQFEAVEAVNGQWISIRFPEYSSKDSKQVVFERNRRVNNVRVVRTSLVFKQ
jgi:eukaryotic-like serine/threonine-protein kinase